ncbi:phosphatase PAP2 family protein [Clostridium tyrobutyricum]|uniref:phosphatase PAP2 family protein n=1 Tax=Clostridium tyrobutyricum TaxID=1519 RepID=UPI001C383DE6|nr:phosphatase PAP2 family protein [Clostridium tyrobutyricum]MBV4425721.1 phosphatase PAP2 family protein [Clostridium tyrobutyricum]
MHMTFFIHQFDNSILQFIQNNMHGYIMDKLMILVTSLGDMGIIWIAIAILLIANKKYRHIGYMTVMAIILGAVFGEVILKHIFQRPRPFIAVHTLNVLISKPTSSSFPSGHTTAAFAAAGILSECFKKYGVAFWILAVLIAFSRLYLYMHYPTDVMGGIALGLICSRLTFYIFKRYEY